MKTKYYCIEEACNNIISYDSANYGQGRCRSCSKKGELSSVFKKGKPKCLDCKKSLTDYRSIRCNSCSKKTDNNPMWKKFGYQHHNFKGRISTGKDGYIQIHYPQHPFANNSGYVREHRLVMENKIGRYLRPGEIVHHKGTKYPIDSITNKQDNRIENLMLFINIGFHNLYHKAIKHIIFGRG